MAFLFLLALSCRANANVKLIEIHSGTELSRALFHAPPPFSELEPAAAADLFSRVAARDAFAAFYLLAGFEPQDQGATFSRRLSLHLISAFEDFVPLVERLDFVRRDFVGRSHGRTAETARTLQLALERFDQNVFGGLIDLLRSAPKDAWLYFIESTDDLVVSAPFRGKLDRAIVNSTSRTCRKALE